MKLSNVDEFLVPLFLVLRATASPNGLYLIYKGSYSLFQRNLNSLKHIVWDLFILSKRWFESKLWQIITMNYFELHQGMLYIAAYTNKWVWSQDSFTNIYKYSIHKHVTFCKFAVARKRKLNRLYFHSIRIPNIIMNCTIICMHGNFISLKDNRLFSVFCGLWHIYIYMDYIFLFSVTNPKSKYCIIVKYVEVYIR